MWGGCSGPSATRAVELSESFSVPFPPPTGDESPKGQNYLLKLIHVNTTARLECAAYQGPFLPLEALGIKELQKDRKATPLQSSLQEVLKGLVGEEAKVRFSVDTIYGWHLGELPLSSWVLCGRGAQGR